MTIKFFQTIMGRSFYEGTLPKLIRTLERIAVALEKLSENATKEDAVHETRNACNCRERNLL
jgi:hypothetical protein